jgi:hypothetical protein
VRRVLKPQLLITVLFVPPLVWVLLDRSVWPWDPAWYGEVSVDLYAALLRSVPEWLHMLATGLPDRAPGLVWVGQFFVPLGGPRGLLLFTVLLETAAAWALFGALAALFEDELAAFAAVAFVCSGPLFAGMTQSYFTEPFEGLGTAMFVYFLARADRRGLWRSALLLGIAALVATFGKITAVLYLFCPALLFIVLCVRRRAELRKRPRLDRGGALLACAFAGGALVLGAWLLICGKAVFEHGFASAVGPVAELYGTRSGPGHKMVYWVGNLDRLFLGPVTRVAFPAAFGAAIAMAFARRKRLDWADWVALASLSEIALVVLALSLIVNEDGRFLFCLFPFAGVAACWALARLGRRALTIAYIGAALAQFGLVYAQAFGLTAPRSYVQAIDRTGAGLDLVRRAVASTCTPQQNGRLFMAGVDIPRSRTRARASNAITTGSARWTVIRHGRALSSATRPGSSLSTEKRPGTHSIARAGRCSIALCAHVNCGCGAWKVHPACCYSFRHTSRTGGFMPDARACGRMWAGEPSGWCTRRGPCSNSRGRCRRTPRFRASSRLRTQTAGGSSWS